MRPILRPGFHVLRRDRHALQIGLAPNEAVVLADDPDVRASIALLERCADEQEYDDPRVLDALRQHGLLLDAGMFMPQLGSGSRSRRPTNGPSSTPRGDVAAVARRWGDDGKPLLEARRRCRIAIQAFSDSADLSLADELEHALQQAGLLARTRTGREGLDEDIGCVALVGVGEPRREVTDVWVRAGVAHLLVRLSEGSAVVGPFVEPGKTACLRCVDAHHTDSDPSWPLLVAQYASAAGSDRADGVPEPVDSLLARLAVAWAGRDLASYAEGLRPSTWSATIQFNAHLTSVETRSLLRHPECGCGWA